MCAKIKKKLVEKLQGSFWKEESRDQSKHTNIIHNKNVSEFVRVEISKSGYNSISFGMK